MKMSCPSCGFIADADAFLDERAGLDGLAIALTMPAGIAAPLMQYLRLFRPAKRALTIRRAVTLLGELVEPIKAGQIERRGRIWPAPTAYWLEAFEELLAKRDAGKLTLPLRSHGYLYEVVAAIASKAEARGEKAREDRVAGRTPVGRAEPAGIGPVASAAPALAPKDDPVAQRGLQTVKAALSRVANIQRVPGAPDAS